MPMWPMKGKNQVMQGIGVQTMAKGNRERFTSMPKVSGAGELTMGGGREKGEGRGTCVKEGGPQRCGI
jgi:hypothetical protein